MKFIIYVTICWMTVGVITAQNVGIGTATPHNSAKLDITSTNSGLLVPRMSSAQRISITNPAEGLVVYDTLSKSFWYYKANYWVELSTKNEDNKVPRINSKYDSRSLPGEECSELNAVINDNGTICLVYLTEVGGETDIVIDRYFKGVWSKKRIYNVGPNSNLSLGINNNEHILLAFTQVVDGFKRVKYIQFDGTTWYGPNLASPNFSNANNPIVAINNNNRYYITWTQPDAVCDRIFLSAFDGVSWNHPATYFNYFNPNWGFPANNYPCFSPQISITDNNNAILVWRQYTTSQHVFKAEYDGSNWSLPSSETSFIEVNPSSPGENYFLLNFQVKYAEMGDAVILFHWLYNDLITGIIYNVVKYDKKTNGSWLYNIQGDYHAGNSSLFVYTFHNDLQATDDGNFYFSNNFYQPFPNQVFILHHVGYASFSSSFNAINPVTYFDGISINSSGQSFSSYLSNWNSGTSGFQVFDVQRPLNNYNLENIIHTEFINETPQSIQKSIPLFSENNRTKCLTWLGYDGGKTRVYASTKE